MQVILRQHVKGLGEPDAVVTVADGYARNFLLPRGLAVQATPAGLKALAATQQRAQARSDQDRDEAEALRERIDGQTVVVTARAGESGRLFGSVTAQDLAGALAEQAGAKVDRRRIELEEPIKRIGSYTATVRLHTAVTAILHVEVRPEQAEAEGRGAGV